MRRRALRKFRVTWKNAFMVVMARSAGHAVKQFWRKLHQRLREAAAKMPNGAELLRKLPKLKASQEGGWRGVNVECLA